MTVFVKTAVFLIYAQTASGLFAQNAAGGGYGGGPPFPADHPISQAVFVIDTRRLEIEAVYNRARDLWESGSRAEALAELRRGERDHPHGGLLRPIRAEAEASIGLSGTNDENRLRRRAPMFFASVSFFFATILSLICFWVRNSAGLRRAMLFLMAVSVLAGFFSLHRMLNPPPQAGRALRGARYGVMLEAEARREPAQAGERIYAFRCGQPVRLLRGIGTPWVWAVANDSGGAAGWVPAEAVIFY